VESTHGEDPIASQSDKRWRANVLDGVTGDAVVIIAVR
jgi:hypothetical protein